MSRRQPTHQPLVNTQTLLAACLTTLALGFSSQGMAVQDTTTTYKYDAGGNLTQAVSPINTPTNPVTTDHLYDVLDQRNVTTQPKPTPSATTRPNTFYQYDGQGQTTRIEDPRVLATNYSVDGLGNVTNLTSPDTGATTNTYDAAGNLKTSTDARGKVTTYTYDALGRVTNIAYATGTPTVLTYDGGTGNTNANNVGRLTRIDGESGYTTYSYNAAGQVLSKGQLVLSVNQEGVYSGVSYGYGTSGGGNGKLAYINYPSGNRINYLYNSAGQITSVTLNPVNANGYGINTAALTNILTSIKYTPSGQFYSGIWGNHTTTTWSGLVHTDDQDGRVTSYHLGNPSNGGTLRTVQYDAASRITSYNHTGTGTGVFAPTNFNQSFTYDNLGRLTTFNGFGVSQSYAYDASGNRISLGANNYSIAATSNRLLTNAAAAPTRTYDAAGNLLTDGTATYTYSDRGRLKSATVGTTTTSYTYNALGQRVSKLTGGTIGNLIQYLYDEQGHLLGEYDVYNNPLQETVYLGDQPIAVLNQTVTAAATGVQVDNTDTTNVTVVGAWPVDSTVAGFIGTNYQSHPATTVTDSFTWKLTLPTVGKYLFQARWPADASRAGNATYAAFSTDGISTRLVDQKTNSNTWTDLRIKLSGAANTLATLKLTPTTAGTVAADAVRALPLTVTTTVNYVFTDHLNTPRVITRASDNQMVWRWDSAEPFGNSQPNPNPAGLGTFTYNPRFPGQLYDVETGLYYNYHRSYSPSVGIYTQSDPIGLRGGINTYAYVGGNPVNFTDPKGLFLQAVIPWVLPSLGQAIVDAATIGLGGAMIADSLISEDEGQSVPIDLPGKIPDFDFDKPDQCPVDNNGNQWPWKGQQPQGGDKGGYKNPNGPESLHPDLDHGGDIGPHWDFNDRNGPGYRIGPDGTIWPK